MPIYLDTSGNSIISVGICDRCNRKFAYTDLMPDPNFPGMRVCKDDVDNFDPWRLPARQTENITLRHPRPDVSIALEPNFVITENGFENGNNILIEGVPPAGGSTGDLNTNSGATNTLFPIISAVSPASGPMAGVDSFIITGNNFTDVMTVKFGNNNATSIVLISPYQARGIVPGANATGYVNVSVITAFGTAVRPGSYLYT